MGSVLDIRREELFDKAREKTGFFFADSGMNVPDGLVIEQASSSATAHFVASLITEGKTVADLTAGLGINTFFLCRKAHLVYAVERDLERAKALEINLRYLEIHNAIVICDDALEWIKSEKKHLDIVFIDPSRRNETGKKFFRLTDCSPNLDELLPFLRTKCSRLLVKCSPLLDLKEAIRLYPEITHIYIVEYKRDVREILLDMTFDIPKADPLLPLISCVILMAGEMVEMSTFSIDDWDLNHTLPYLIGQEELKQNGYIYEPSPVFMKSGFFGGMIKEYPDMCKLDPNTHLFYSAIYHPGFPGRIFRIENFFSSRDLKKSKGSRYNVISRNHPATPGELVSRFKFKPSEIKFLIACSIGKDKVILETSKVI